MRPERRESRARAERCWSSEVSTLRAGNGIHSPRVEALSWTAASATEWVVTAVNVGSRSGTLDTLAYCR